MNLLRDHEFRRGALGRPRHADGRSISVRLPILLFVSLALLTLDRLGNGTARGLRSGVEGLVAPALGLAMTPMAPLRRLADKVQVGLDGFSDLERLRAANQRLTQWEARAHDLERQVGELSRLTHVVAERDVDFRTVRVVASSTGTFVQSALIEAGIENGVKPGMPVIDASGVLGRIVEAGRTTSRVLLLSDINSRVPVQVGPARLRAILAGDNSPTPRLTMLPPDAVITAGDEITTSGLGGLFPRGLRVGVVGASTGREGEARNDPQVAATRVELAAELDHPQYATVLLYDNPGQVLAAELRQGQLEAQSRRRGAVGDGRAERPAEGGRP